MPLAIWRRLTKLFAWWRRLREMPSSYHGSNIVYIGSRSIFFLRQALKKFRSQPAQADIGQSRLIQAYRATIANRDWHAALPLAHKIADIAEQKRNPDLMAEMSSALLRLGDYSRPPSLSLAARHIRNGKIENEWNGEDISDKVLLVELTENAKQSLGRVIRHAQMIPSAVRRAKHCIVLVESRLVPIFRRSFPSADIRADGANNDAIRAEVDVFASFPQLAFIFAKNADAIRNNFAPLRADEKLTEMFRVQYSKSGLPLVGLSWGSKSYNKDIPSLGEWSQFIQREPAQFVSLQYGKVSIDLPRLTGNNPERVIHDTSVDQLKDMDRFAAQISALDAVVSISNTAAHFAGALDIPSIFVIDDKFHTSWPVIGDRIPWYPRGQVVLRGGRDWTSVLSEVSARLHVVLEKRNR